MLALELISQSLPPLKPEENGSKAIKWMEEFKVYHLPVVDDHRYLGLVSEDEILDSNQLDLPVTEFLNDHRRPFVTDDQHIYDVLRTITAADVSVIAVLESNGDFLGSVTLHDLLIKFEALTAISQAGGIVVLEIEQNDYSLAKIAHVIESNDSKILSSYVSNKSNSRMELTIKVDREELAPILQSLERHEYVVVGAFQEKQQLDDLRNRYDSFMRYINI
ncbi:MAG: acetoin utilization protein AcuB [Granulosicoccus sp.]